MDESNHRTACVSNKNRRADDNVDDTEDVRSSLMCGRALALPSKIAHIKSIDSTRHKKKYIYFINVIGKNCLYIYLLFTIRERDAIKKTEKETRANSRCRKGISLPKKIDCLLRIFVNKRFAVCAARADLNNI